METNEKIGSLCRTCSLAQELRSENVRNPCFGKKVVKLSLPNKACQFLEFLLSTRMSHGFFHNVSDVALPKL